MQDRSAWPIFRLLSFIRLVTNSEEIPEYTHKERTARRPFLVSYVILHLLLKKRLFPIGHPPEALYLSIH